VPHCFQMCKVSKEGPVSGKEINTDVQLAYNPTLLVKGDMQTGTHQQHSVEQPEHGVFPSDRLRWG